MLSHATHKHSYQTCHAHDEEKKAKVMEALKGAADIGIKVGGIRRPSWARILFCFWGGHDGADHWVLWPNVRTRRRYHQTGDEHGSGPGSDQAGIVFIFLSNKPHARGVYCLGLYALAGGFLTDTFFWRGPGTDRALGQVMVSGGAVLPPKVDDLQVSPVPGVFRPHGL